MTASRSGGGLPYEPSLDGVRGVAIAGVVLYHACAASGLTGWFRGGFIGVSVFFTLSGYLITSVLLAEHDRTGRVDLAHFVSRRIRRLSPALLVTVLAVIVLSATGVLAAKASDAVAAAWSVTNWHVIASGESQLLRTIVGPLGPTWSLAVEEQLYVVLVVGVLWAARSGRPERAVLIGAGVVSVASVVSALTVSDWNPRLEFGTDVRAAEVAIGVALAAATRLGLMPVPRGRTADLVAGVGLLVIAVGFMWIDLTPNWILRGGYALLACVTAAVLHGLLAHGRVAAWLGCAPLVALGRSSYSLYLVHWPMISVLTTARTGIDGAALAAVQVAASLAAATALSIAVEQPVRRLPPTRVRRAVAFHLAGVWAVTLLAVALL